MFDCSVASAAANSPRIAARSDVAAVSAASYAVIALSMRVPSASSAAIRAFVSLRMSAELAATAPVRVESAFWNAVTISVSESSASASVLLMMLSTFASSVSMLFCRVVSPAALSSSSCARSSATAWIASALSESAVEVVVVRLVIRPSIRASSPSARVCSADTAAIRAFVS
mgnify:CR=1 FL=1